MHIISNFGQATRHDALSYAEMSHFVPQLHGITHM